jgi:signal transduction histidine kinase
MSSTTALFGAMLLINLTFAVSIVYGLRTRQATPGGRPAAAFLIALTIWLFGRLLEDAAPDLAGKVFWARVEYFGIATVPVFWLLFALEFARGLRFPWPRPAWLLFAVPVLTIAAAWTNDTHRLLWRMITPSPDNPGILVYTHGLWFYVALIHNYICVVTGSMLTLRHAVVRSATQRGDAMLLALGAVLPLAANLIYVLGLSPIKGFDLTPFGLTLAVSVWATSKLRDRVLDIVPARDALLTHLQDGVVIVDDLGMITDMNPAARTVLTDGHGTAPKHWATLLRDRFAIDDTKTAETVLRSEVISRHDGKQRDFELVVSPVYERRQFVGRIALLHDISARKHDERRIQELNATLERQVADRTRQLGHTVNELKDEVSERRAAEHALQQLSKRLATIQETERASIARELHDQVGANLSALGMNLSLVKTLMPKQAPVDVVSRLNDSNALLVETTEIVRGIMSELRPPLLDDYGLLSALRWLAGQWQSRTRIPVEINGDDPGRALPADAAIALFRIAQEALSNIARHSQATHVWIDIKLCDDAGTRAATVSIRDNGAGFDGATLTPPDGVSGWGMGTMRERARSAGGQLDVSSAPGRGTCVTAHMPLGGGEI